MPKGIYPHKPSPRKGIPLPEEIRRKISEGMKGKKNALGKHFFLSEEAKRKISQRQRGRKLSEETKRKRSLAQTERYKDENERMKTSLAMKGIEHSEETKKKISAKQKGRKHLPQEGFQKGHKPYKIFKENPKTHIHDGYKRHPITVRHFDVHKLPEYRRKVSNSVKKLWQNPEYRRAHTGPNHRWWKGGLTKREETLAHALRVELRNWTKEVLERDNYICQKCGQRFEKIFLHTHHIKPISKYPSLILDVSNGITLCKNCHFTTESFGRKLEKSAKILLNAEKRQFINKISNNS